MKSAGVPERSVSYSSEVPPGSAGGLQANAVCVVHSRVPTSPGGPQDRGSLGAQSHRSPTPSRSASSWIGLAVRGQLSHASPSPSASVSTCPGLGRAGQLSDMSGIPSRSVSRRQVEVQPSPLAVLPSSHCSPGSSAPLPHTARQSSGQISGSSPCSHRPLPQNCSTWQVAEQPSPLVVLPSSHCSPGSSVPLPHTAAQSCGQDRGSSLASQTRLPHRTPSAQPAEQPSPFAVLPSSHCSPASSTPSPHTAGQSWGQLRAFSPDAHRPLPQNDSTWQVAEQPSPFLVLASSHCSPGSSTPLPHTPGQSCGQVRGSSPVSHRPLPQNDSTWQVAEQPSPFLVLASSHCSPGSSTPLPHTPGQSCGQVRGSSPVSHRPLPQNDSTWQVAEQPSPF